MARMSIDKAANLANLRSRACKNCHFNLNSTRGVCEVCFSAFVEGFKKGAKYAKRP